MARRCAVWAGPSSDVLCVGCGRANDAAPCLMEGAAELLVCFSGFTTETSLKACQTNLVLPRPSSLQQLEQLWVGTIPAF